MSRTITVVFSESETIEDGHWIYEIRARRNGRPMGGVYVASERDFSLMSARTLDAIRAHKRAQVRQSAVARIFDEEDGNA